MKNCQRIGEGRTQGRGSLDFREQNKGERRSIEKERTYVRCLLGPKMDPTGKSGFWCQVDFRPYGGKVQLSGKGVGPSERRRDPVDPGTPWEKLGGSRFKRKDK